ncbi:autotransporter outer membrane beta-barrel domain-containing protein [Ahrensia sp. R2A130]|uniref:autotransporter family protein n=1 Tax=Ahrensia sp. R2A130 TaxID=744979 RepID=UPI0001E0B53D|nr:autotransporter outer membrane beta-barrel domain-containing protein [Ahrensia sp. R2A130]EFL87809.1 putative outer membrane autotransporter barrel domain protein [Ahrensia sp. R2A130]
MIYSLKTALRGVAASSLTAGMSLSLALSVSTVSLIASSTSAHAACAIDAANPLLATCTGADVDGFSVPSDGFTVNVLDGATVTNGGDAIGGSSRDNVRVVNDGSLTSTSADGVDLDDFGTVINNGAIVADDNGIEGGDNGVYINNGTITVIDDDGINVDNRSRVENHGTIIADDEGIEVDEGSTVVNTGLVRARGGQAIEGNEANTRIFNSGTLISTSDDGIDIGDQGFIQNSGSIFGEDSGIIADGGTVTIVNSGLVADLDGPTGRAIRAVGADLSLTLLPGSVLVGSLEPGAGTDMLTLAPGLDAILEVSGTQFESIAFGSPLQTILGQQIVQVDTTTMALVDDAFADVAGNVGLNVQNRIDSAFAAPGAPAEGVAAYGSSFTSGFSPAAGARTYWSSAFAARTASDQSFPAGSAASGSIGTVSGIDISTGNAGLYGVFAGGAYGLIESSDNNGAEIDSQAYYAGVYGRTQLNSIAFNAVLTGGWMKFDSNRTVANNTVVGGLETAKADYSGFFIAPQLTASSQWGVGGHSILPSFSVGYAGLFLDGYTEAGSAANVTVNDRDIHVFNARLKIALVQDVENSDGTMTTLRPYLGVEGRTATGDADKINATLLGNNVSFDPGGETSKARGFVGFDFARPVTDTISVFGRTEVGYETDDRWSGAVQLGFSATF